MRIGHKHPKKLFKSCAKIKKMIMEYVKVVTIKHSPYKFQNSEAATMFLEISQNSLETSELVSFLIKLQALGTGVFQ